LSGIEEYAPIVKLLNDLADREPEKIILNLQKLEFLNSSGINVLSKYVIKVRQKGTIQMVVKGSKSIPWQAKSLKNLQRLMPSLQLELQ
jgi:anti-anti-sigma factor